MTDDNDNIRPLGIEFKRPPEDDPPMLKIVNTWEGACNHSFEIRGGQIINAQYIMREGEAEVECGFCHVRLDPMFVLAKLARRESDWHRHRKQHQEEMKRLNARSRTKCQHCGEMTRISSR